MGKVKKIIIITIIILISIGTISIATTKNSKSKTYIDTPVSNAEIEGNNLIVSGWVMSVEPNYEIKIYLNGAEQKVQEMTRRARPDVIDAIPGYGGLETNPKPGYAATIDISNIKDGYYELETKIISKAGEELTNATRMIKIQKYKARTYIDNIKNNKNELQIAGWIMSTDKDRIAKIYIDGKEQVIEKTTTRVRPDVINAIPGYGGLETNPEPGYASTINISQIKDGVHEIKIVILSNKNEILTQDTRTINIEKYKARTYIDSPRSGVKIEGNKLTISGWVMSTDKDRSIKIYIDGKEQTIEKLTTRVRPDVINAVPGYGDLETNPEPGYAATIDISNIKDGIHEIKTVILSDSNEILNQDSRTIDIEKYRARTYMDNPKNGTKVEGNKLTISGWIMSTDKDRTIKIYIDGKEQTIEKLTTRVRPDVINVIPGYGGIEKNPEPGYAATIDILHIKDGKHAIKIQIISNDNKVLAEDTRTIYIEKYKAKSYIDSPAINGQAKNTLTVAGWIMSTDVDRKINIYLNNEKQTIKQLTTRVRPDVINAIPGYGGLETNPEPGYAATIDVSGKTDGKYMLKVQITSRTGEILTEETRQIVIYNKYGVGIDVSKHNGVIDWAKVKNSGIDFAIIRAGNRGYGEEGNLVEDPRFVENMKGAISNGIEVGVYIYSQAINEQEAIQEAELAIRLIKDNGFGNDITYPIVIDCEASSGRGDKISVAQRTKNIKAFCERIKQAGYKPMLYSNKYWLETQIDMSQLGEYDVWLAHYTGTDDPINNPSDYKGNYQIWQYTSTGSVPGISGNVDINVGYKKYFK